MTDFDYRNILECLPQAILAADATHRIVFANHAVEGLLGYDANALAGRQLGEILPQPVHPNDFGHAIAAMVVIGDGSSREFEVVMARRSGNGPELFVATFRDRVDLAKLEREARKLRGVIDSISVGVMLLESPSTPPSIVNRAAARIAGEPHDLLSHEEFRSRFPIGRLDGKGDATDRAPDNGESFRFRRRDGNEMVLDVTATPMPGQPGAAVITFADATERHRQIQESADRAAQFRALLDHVPVGVVYFDKMAVCRAGNGPARRFLGRGRGEIAGVTADELFANAPTLGEALHRCVRDHLPHAEAGVAWPDGSRAGDPRFLDWKFEPLGLDPAKPRGAIALVVDVTESTRAKGELLQAMREAEGASRRKTQFLSAVSHDLRTPVNALSLQAELLGYIVAMSDDPHGELGQLASDIRTVAGNLIELINDLLDLTRFDSGMIEYQVQEFPLDGWLAATLAPLELTAKTKGLALSWTSDRPGRALRGDRVKIGRVLLNLVGNAIKFTDKGQVRVEAKQDAEGWLRLEVHDTGAGIPADQRERIFDEFAQLRNPERDRTKGTGLGLAICRRLVEGVGGRLALESQPGAGSTFTAIYPPDHIVPAAQDLSEEKPDRPAIRTPEPGALTLLLVEDDTNSLKVLGRLLTHAGYRMLAATSGPAALETIAAYRPDLVLLDLMLPGMDGMEVLRRIRADASLRETQVIVLTGDVAASREAELRDLGIAGLLCKPVNFDELQSLLTTKFARIVSGG